MATIEYITKRIQGANERITKLEAKLNRINIALNGGANPYGYSDYDLRYTTEDLAEARKSLDKYTAQLTEAQDKAASRNVPAITEFLNAWKARMTEFYTERFSLYPAAVKQYEDDMKPYKMDYYQERKFRKESPDEWKTWSNERQAIKGMFETRFGFLAPYINRVYNHTTQRYDAWELDTAKLEQDLQQEYNRKYDFILDRTCAIIGQVTDASHLTIGAKDDLNGYIVGTKGAAKIQTIGAGGYNIQCFHFRTLIHPMPLPKYPHDPKPQTKTPAKPQTATSTQDFKGMSIEQLRDLLAQLGGECKVYDNQAIYRMRLIMAIKKFN